MGSGHGGSDGDRTTMMMIIIRTKLEPKGTIIVGTFAFSCFCFEDSRDNEDVNHCFFIPGVAHINARTAVLPLVGHREQPPLTPLVEVDLSNSASFLGLCCCSLPTTTMNSKKARCLRSFDSHSRPRPVFSGGISCNGHDSEEGGNGD